MKKIALLLFAMGLLNSASYSQEIFIDGVGGYHLGTSKDYGTGKFRISDGLQFGGSLNVDINGTGVFGRLRYVRQHAEFFVDDFRVAEEEIKMSDLRIHWIQMGAFKQWEVNDKFYPFAGGDIGAAIFQPVNQTPNLEVNSLESTARFNLNIHGGARYYFYKGLGVQLEANLMLPADWASEYFSFGTDGPAAGISVGTTTLIPTFNAGLVLSLGKEDKKDETE